MIASELIIGPRCDSAGLAAGVGLAAGEGLAEGAGLDAGDWDAGDWDAGDWDAGDWDAGDWDAGDWGLLANGGIGGFAAPSPGGGATTRILFWQRGHGSV